MTNYIQFPRYCLYLIPNENFTHDFNVFCKENSINSSSLNELIYGFHSTVKAPFYLSHLYTEDSLIKKFQNIDTQINCGVPSKDNNAKNIQVSYDDLINKFTFGAMM